MSQHSWIPDGWIGIKETATRLGVSDKTVRRRIEAGEIKAKMIDSPYGRPMWVVDETQIQTTQQIINVVEVKQKHELQDIALTLAQLMNDRDARMEDKIQELTQNIHHLQKPVLDEIQKLREENVRLYDLVDKRLAERDIELMEQIREKQAKKKRSWWNVWK